ncbi:MAG: hypothetical protein HY462_00110 [Parcubacteria group bacterium]|nr:hypothetical protein [Parcubacteria group bacterium]
MAQQLDQAILSTLVYFDIFDFPLTFLELHRFLLNRGGSHWSLHDVRTALAESEVLGRAVRERDGFYFLRGRDVILGIRAERYVLAKAKYSRALGVGRVLSRLPFVRGIFVCNSLAYANASYESDIDLVISAKRGGVWWARLFCLSVLHALHLRPGQGGYRDKLCITTFIDDAHAAMGDWRMIAHDVDFTYWAANFYPLYDAGEHYAKFWAANADWLSEFLPNARPTFPNQSRTVRLSAVHPARALLEWALAPFSGIAEWVQRKRFPEAIRTLLNRDTRVRVEEGRLKFHVRDARMAHAEQFVKRFSAVTR